MEDALLLIAKVILLACVGGLLFSSRIRDMIMSKRKRTTTATTISEQDFNNLKSKVEEMSTNLTSLRQEVDRAVQNQSEAVDIIKRLMSDITDIQHALATEKSAEQENTIDIDELMQLTEKLKNSTDDLAAVLNPQDK